MLNSNRALLLFALFANVLAWAPALRAQECADDAACPEGYACTAFEQSCPPCDPAGGECPPCEPTSASYCEIVVAPCASDADCADGLVCVHFTGESCAGSTPCAPDDPACVPEPGACETVDESQCAPPWIAACDDDADCGPGFLCVEQEVCSCTVYPDPGTGEPPPPEECTCETSGDRYCELQIVACDDDADCAAGLVCTEGPSCAAPCSVDENGVTDCPCDGAGSICGPPGFVNPLPVDQSGSGGVEASREEDLPAEGEGEGEGEAGDDDDGCASTGGVPLVLALVSLLFRRRAGSSRPAVCR